MIARQMECGNAAFSLSGPGAADPGERRATGESAVRRRRHEGVMVPRFLVSRATPAVVEPCARNRLADEQVAVDSVGEDTGATASPT